MKHFFASILIALMMYSGAIYAQTNIRLAPFPGQRVTEGYQVRPLFVADSSATSFGMEYRLTGEAAPFPVDSCQTFPCPDFIAYGPTVMGTTLWQTDSFWLASVNSSDTLKVPTSLQLGQSWVWKTMNDTVLMATVSAIVADTVFMSVPDTLLQIRIEANYLGSAIPSGWDTLEFWLSARFGWATGPVAHSTITAPRVFTLLSVDSLPVPYQNYGNQEIFAFNVGDVFHRKQCCFFPTQPLNGNFYANGELYLLDTIVGILATLPSPVYRIRRGLYSPNGGNAPIIGTTQQPLFQLVDDTIGVQYLDVWNHHPGIVDSFIYPAVIGEYVYFNMASVGNGILPPGTFAKSNAPEQIWGAGLLLFQANTDPDYIAVAPGIGEVSISSMGGNRQLVYWQKGGTSRGTPVDVTGAYVVSGQESATTLNLNLYPNPAQDWLELQLGPETASATFSLLDTQGRIVATEPLHTGRTRISVTHFPTGLYSWQVVGLAGHSSGGRIAIVR